MSGGEKEGVMPEPTATPNISTGVSPRHEAATFAARAALACALVMAGLLVVCAVGFAILAGGGSEATDFSWAFAVYILPTITILTVLLFVATLVLAIVALVRGRGRSGRRAAVIALIVAVVVVLVYIGWAFVLAALLSPATTG